jgi:hypothetical protein
LRSEAEQLRDQLAAVGAELRAERDRAVPMAGQLAAVAEELRVERDIRQRLHEQLVSVGKELRAERERTASLTEQLAAVAEELRHAREIHQPLHEQLVSVGAELRAEREGTARAQEASALAQRIIALRPDAGALDPKRADPKIWAVALDQVIAYGAVDAAVAAAPLLASAFPGMAYLRTMARTLQQLPAQTDDPGFSSFVEDVSAAFQLVRRRNADALLIAVCGAGRPQQLGLPINLMHRCFGQLGAHVLYLRDLRRDNMDGGIEGIAESYAGVIEAIRTCAADLRVSRMFCFGNSFGGYLALRAGLDLKAEAVLTFGGPTNPKLSADFPRTGISPGLDLRPLYAAPGGQTPRVHLVYGEEFEQDRLQAHHMAGLPRVTMAGLPGLKSHGVIQYLMEHGHLSGHLQWLADPGRHPLGPRFE